MNIKTLLNKNPSLIVSVTRLTSLVLKDNRREIVSKSRLLKQREEISDQRINSFRALQKDASREEILNNTLLGGGLTTGAGLSLLRGKKTANNIRPFRRPIKPGKFSGLGRLSKGSVITNTLFAGLDFANRKSAGQTNLQAGLGAGGTAVGGIAGAAIGQALIPIPVLGALIGGFVGANIGSGLADRASGVTGSDFRRLELERESIRQSSRTEFTEGLDRFDSALDKLEQNEDDLRAFILRARGDDNRDRAFDPIIPRRGGATQKQIDSAYAKGIQVGAGSLVVGTVGTVLAIKGGAFLLSGALLTKLKGLGAFVLVKSPKLRTVLQKVLEFAGLAKGKNFDLNKIRKFPGRKIEIFKKTPKVKKIRPKVTRSRTKPFQLRKRIEGQDKVTFSDKVPTYKTNKTKRFQQLDKVIKSNKGKDIRQQRRLIRKVEKEITKPKSNEVRDAKKVLEEFIKNNPELKDLNIKPIETNVTNKDIQNLLQKGIKGLSKDSPLKKLFNMGDDLSDNTIIKEGDNYLAFNLSNSPTIIEGDSDPYLSSLNTIKAYSELTA